MGLVAVWVVLTCEKNGMRPSRLLMVGLAHLQRAKPEGKMIVGGRLPGAALRLPQAEGL